MKKLFTNWNNKLLYAVRARVLKRALRKQHELQRILNIAGGKVTFIAKDYRDRAIKKPVTMDGVEFLRRFTMHILPGRSVKIRRYGIYNHTAKRNLKLQFIPEQSPDIVVIKIPEKSMT